LAGTLPGDIAFDGMKENVQRKTAEPLEEQTDRAAKDINLPLEK